jgi:HEPN domain-containing protein
MNKIIIEEWLTRAKRDFDVAHKLFSDSNHLEIVLFHVQQAVEKYLKGYLIFKGWRLRKIHDIEVLLTEAIQHDKKFQEFLDLGRKLTAIYYEERYPPGAISVFTVKEVKDIIENSNRIIQLIESFLKI